jgi:WD40 repeat protein
MNIERIALVGLFLVMLSITACGGGQPVETLSMDEPPSSGEESLPVTSEIVDEDTSELGQDLPSAAGSQTVINRQNAGELVQTDSLGRGGVIDFAWSPDGNTLGLASFSGITLVEMSTQDETKFSTELLTHQIGHIITFSPDGDLLAVSNYKSVDTNVFRGSVDIFDVASQELLFTLDDFENWNPFGIAFSPDGVILATGWGNWWGGGPGGVKLWDVSTGDLIHEFRYERLATIYNLAFNHKGDLLAAISGEGGVDIRDITAGQTVRNFQGISGYGNAVAFSPDDKLLAAGGGDTDGYSYGSDEAELCIFDVKTGKLVIQLEGHKAIIRSLAFSAAGDVLASASADNSVRLWDVETGQQLAILAVSGATSVAFSPDGTLLATARIEDGLGIWAVPEP